MKLALAATATSFNMQGSACHKKGVTSAEYSGVDRTAPEARVTCKAAVAAKLYGGWPLASGPL